MERLNKSLELLCDRFDNAKIEDKGDLCDLMDRVADISIKMSAEERAVKKLDLDHEEADRKIDATFSIQESREIREDRKEELERAKAEAEIDAKQAEIEAKKKERIAQGIVAVLGTATTAAVGIAGIKNSKHIFDNLKEWDDHDVIPTSTGWDVFRKNLKL